MAKKLSIKFLYFLPTLSNIFCRHFGTSPLLFVVYMIAGHLRRCSYNLQRKKIQVQ
jgi:hypothetical protein